MNDTRSAVAAFDRLIEDALKDVPPIPPVIRHEPGAKIPFYGVEEVEIIEDADGKEVDFHMVVRNLGMWVVTAAFDLAGNLITNLQLKRGVNQYTIQLAPGGVKLTDDNLGPEEVIMAAQPTFIQETGYAGGSWKYLGYVNVDDNKVRNAANTHGLRAHLVLATGLKRVAAPQPKSTEFYRLQLISRDQFPALMQSRFLTETSAVTCLYKAFAELGMLSWI